MDYCLFFESDVRYGASLCYYRYGIYGDLVRTEQEGEELYFLPDVQKMSAAMKCRQSKSYRGGKITNAGLFAAEYLVGVEEQIEK